MKKILMKFKQLKTSHKLFLIFVGLIYITLILLCVIKVNYTLTTPGTLTKTSNLVAISDENYQNDSGLVYGIAVYSTDRISLFKYLICKNNKNMKITPYDPKNDLTKKEDQVAGKIYMNQSSINAIIASYTLASKIDENIKISYNFKGMVVTNLTHAHLSADLQIGDLIIKIAGYEVGISTDYYDHLKKDYLNENDKFDLVVKRGEEVITLEADTYTVGESKYCTWYAEECYEIDEENTYPKFEIKSTSVSGPSAGLMQSLALYNMLTSTDITKGKVIAGTGTIEINNEENHAGAIGSVKLKIKTAALVYNLSYFFVDEADYAEALEAYNEISNPRFELVSVSSLDDIIAFLKEIE